MKPISGHTRILAHLGVPTESFRAPLIYNPFFKARGIDARVIPMGCEAVDFPDFLRLVLRLRNAAGAIVTMPHKMPVVELLDEASPAVRVCGACNAVRMEADGRLTGDMFDGEGFVRGLLRKGRVVSGATAFVCGAGGVGSAIAASLAAAGAARLRIFDVDPARAARLAEALSAHFPSLDAAPHPNDPAETDIVVNATPLGMKPGDPLPTDVERVDPAAIVGDVILTEDMTPFLTAARARGCAVQIGSDMLFEQIPAYLEFFGFPSTTAEELRLLALDPA